MASKEKVGELIRTRRMSRGWTQEELAEKIQISASAIGMYESGRRYPKPDIIEALADAFNVPKWAITMTEDEIQSRSTARQELFDDPERKALLDFARNGSLESVRQINAVIDALRATNPDYYDGDDPA